ncbi:MAG: S41 family peptidase [Flavobacteriales bacterium]|nr:S41 family peptidase [Flavobacteriales bacterium]
MNSLIKYTLLAFYCIASSSLNAQNQDVWVNQDVSSDAFKSDMSLLWKVLNENHSGLFNYSDSLEFASYLEEYQQINDSLKMHEAFYELAGLVNLIKDGHTYIMPNDHQDEALLSSVGFLPFTFKIIKNSLLIDQNFGGARFEKGMEVIAIDGMKTEDLLGVLREYMTTDGCSPEPKNDMLEGQLWWYYGLHFGFKERHHLVYLDKYGRRNAAFVGAVSFYDRHRMLEEGLGREEEALLSYKLIGDAAYLRVTRFWGWSARRYGKTLDEAFDFFAQNKCRELIIDIRGNGGGREGFENRLLSHLNHSLEEKYDRVLMKRVFASEYSHLEKGFVKRFEDLLYRAIEFRKTQDGFWERRNRFQSSWKQKTAPFEGLSYVLIDGEVFSGAAEFSSMAKDYGVKCVLVGEETGGGYQGNTSGYFYTLELPNTGFVVKIPRILFDLAVKDNSWQGGVMPDIIIPDKVEDYIKGEDTQLNFVLSLIQNGYVLSPEK